MSAYIFAAAERSYPMKGDYSGAQMKHFHDEAWVDFTRRVLPLEESNRMQAHLDTGCEDCARLHRLWADVTAMSREESKYLVDDSLIASMKAAFSRRPWRPLRAAESRLLTLVFDSFLDLDAAVGVRSISATARHLLYQSSQLAVDVRIDALSETRVAIAGQVLESGSQSPTRRRLVTLLQASIALAQTSTNDFGEFYFEWDNVAELRIRMEAAPEQPFTLILPD